MTIEEMKRKLGDFCTTQPECGSCPLVQFDCGHTGVDFRILDDAVIAAYETVFRGTGSTPVIKDSGERRQFDTGAVRDIQEGKGRCDLMPLDVLSDHFMIHFGRDNHSQMVFGCLSMFVDSGDCLHLQNLLGIAVVAIFRDPPTMLLEVAKHFEDGAKKYGENNWQKGIPVRCYIDSAVRHYLKWLRGDKDEPHDRAFCWNILCAIWTCKHKPELNDYRKENQDVED